MAILYADLLLRVADRFKSFASGPSPKTHLCWGVWRTWNLY